jgi:hypothetical protein
LVREYLDYYWPEPLVLTGPLLRETSDGTEFALDFIGRHIPVDQHHRHNLTLKVPVRYWESALNATLLKNGIPIHRVVLSEGRHEIAFPWDDRRDVYRLVIGQRFVVGAAVSGQNMLDRPAAPVGQAPPLTRQPDRLLLEDARPRYLRQ